MTESDKAIFKRMWIEGVYEKKLAERFDLSTSQVQRLRVKLDLPPRRGGHRPVKARAATVNVTLSHTLLDKARARARNRQISLSHYLQTLIRRDIGEAV